MISGIGTDVVDIARFERAMSRTPRLGDRLFTAGERLRPARSLAARFAAKEALIKALRGPSWVRWHDMEVVNDEDGVPRFEFHGELERFMKAECLVNTHLSMSHDAGVAIAFVVLERSDHGK